MNGIWFLLFLSVAAEGSVVKRYHFININMTWYSAQAYCRERYTDLAYIDSLTDQKKLQHSAGDHVLTGWIGLSWDTKNETNWRWSGGGLITFTHWANKQPNNHGNNQSKAGVNARGRWNDCNSPTPLPFYCVSLPSVEQSMETWEGALRRCREDHRDLVSLRSDTELLLTQTLMKRTSTERVWIGLRFLGDRWLWVNGDPLGFEAWPADGDHWCPVLDRCGALAQEGAWEGVDCQERLHFICN